MALNFPATPEEGDLYTAEGVTYVWRTNRWVKVSDEALDPVEIVEANAPAGWQVWGDTLIQWGTLTVVGTGATTLTFPKAFKALPALTMEHLSTNAQQFTTQINSMTAVAADVYVLDRNNAFVGTTVRWIAIGEAPDELKKPKVVHEGASGGDPVPVEIVEADAPAGWQVWGDTLIQWGQDVGGNAARTVTFPKAFKTAPRVSCTPISAPTIGSSFLTAVVTDITTTGCKTGVLFDNGIGTQGLASEPGMWIAVGEAPDALKKPKTVHEGASGGDPVPVEIVEADVSQGWQVWGDILVQWGVAQTAADGNVTVTFAQAFKTPPYTSAHSTNEAGNNVIDPCNVTNLSTSSVLIRCRTVQNTGVSPTVRGVRWIAVGEAPDALKKPKVVQTIGGSELQEYHDPSGAASWRIVGTTYEQWGLLTVPVNGTATYGYAKTLKRRPVVTLTAFNGGGVNFDVQEPFNVTGFSPIARRVNDNASIEAVVQYRVIGEWDGVS